MPICYHAPFNVAVESRTCVLTRSYVSPRNVLTSLGWLLMAAKNANLGDDPIIWCWYLDSSIRELGYVVFAINCSCAMNGVLVVGSVSGSCR
jgi:hypothetical protein